MATSSFTYVARTKSGDPQNGTITANSQQAAIALLKQKGLRPITVKPVGGSGFGKNIKLPGRSGVKPKALVIFTRQFSTMINAGVPILRSLSTLRDQTDSAALKEALDQVIANVQGGGQLSGALSQHPRIFSEVYVNMVRAGEAGGILDQILVRLANQVEKDSQIKSKLRGAMVYPAVVTVVAIGAVGFLLTGVIPKLATILTENEVELPIQTKVILALSNFLVHGWPFLIVGIVVSTVAFRRYIKTPSGQYNFHKVLLKVPIFGKIIMKVNVARFARTFSSLASAGVSVIEALNVTSGSLNNAVIKKGIQESIVRIRNGSNIADSLEESHVMPQIIIQMTAVGEETGQLDTVLEKVAEFYEQEVDTVIDSLASIIEPILIVALGGVVGVIVASVLGPIISLQGAV
ncbi:MAG TPA: type II secretion system F family protein [Candidatus Limnocylindria bacterium]|nr:type II secretion system F family protein [Candidatus Limnocylindria bacterium]